MHNIYKVVNGWSYLGLHCFSALPRSILVFSGRYHIISNASLVNNCIMFSCDTPVAEHRSVHKIAYIRGSSLDSSTYCKHVTRPPVKIA